MDKRNKINSRYLMKHVPKRQPHLQGSYSCSDGQDMTSQHASAAPVAPWCKCQAKLLALSSASRPRYFNENVILLLVSDLDSIRGIASA